MRVSRREEEEERVRKQVGWRGVCWQPRAATQTQTSDVAWARMLIKLIALLRLVCSYPHLTREGWFLHVRRLINGSRINMRVSYKPQDPFLIMRIPSELLSPVDVGCLYVHQRLNNFICPGGHDQGARVCLTREAC